MKLTSQNLTLEAGPGKHSTKVEGLSLKVSPKGKGRWVLRYSPEPGKPTEVTLGSREAMTLSQAMADAQAIRDGTMVAKPAMLSKRAPPAPTTVEGVRTFRLAAEEYVTRSTPRWRDPKGASQWRASLKTYAYPHIGDMDVRDIGVADVLRVLTPIWGSKAELANRVRARIESVLIAEAARENRGTDNPASKKLIEEATGIKHVKGDRDGLSVQAQRQGRRGPMAAMPLSDLFEFVDHLWNKAGVSHKALLFTIYTGAREGTICKADWSEIDFDAKVWRIPGEHMKNGKSFEIPLSKQAIQVLTSLGPHRKGLIFKSPRENAPRRKGKEAAPRKHATLTDAAMDRVIHRWLEANPDKPHATVHGMRTVCATELAKTGKFDLTLIDRTLSHQTGSKVLRAYIAGENVELRRPLMDHWGKVVEDGSTEYMFRN